MAHFYDTIPAELTALPHREAVERYAAGASAPAHRREKKEKKVSGRFSKQVKILPDTFSPFSPRLLTTYTILCVGYLYLREAVTWQLPPLGGNPFPWM